MRSPDSDQIDRLLSLYRSGKTDEAAYQCKSMLKQYPTCFTLHQIHGAALKRQGKFREALDAFDAAVRIRPDSADALNNRGVALNALGRHTEAVADHTAAIRLKPDYAVAHNNHGVALQALGRLPEAAKSHETAIRCRPDYAEAYNNLGNVRMESGQIPEATDCFQKAIRYRKDLAQAHNNLGVVLNAAGRLAEAAGCHETAIRLKPAYAEAHRNLSTFKDYQEGDPQIDQMRRLMEKTGISDEDRMHLHFGLGKAETDLGNEAAAFHHFFFGNRIRKQALNYDIDTDRTLFSAITDCFSHHSPSPAAPVQPARRPVFILGMPRSGTTLVEQILASHSAVYGAGELTLLSNILTSEDLASAHTPTAPATALVRKRYLSGLSRLKTDAPLVTDKLPLNFRWIGWIAAALPEAKIIHVKRDPVATCWSIFTHFFSKTGNGYAYDLSDLADYYKLYTGLMDFWHSTFPGKIYDLRYEALTENQVEETRLLLSHVGLPWEDGCLAFHKTRRTVKTASSAQVRQKIYQGSSNRWRRFEPFLTPMIAALNDTQRSRPPLSRDRLNAVNDLYRAGRVRETEKQCKDLLKAGPDSAAVLNLLNLLGAALQARKKSAEAVSVFDALVMRKPGAAQTYNNRGVALKSIGRLKEAIQDYETAIRLKPDYAEAYNNRGNARSRQGQPREAVRDFSRAIRLKPDYAEAYNNLGIALLSLEQPEAALENHKKAIRIRPGVAEFHCDIGNVFHEMGRLGEATAAYDTAIRLKPDFAKAHNNRGTVFYTREQWDEAEKCYHTAIRLKPDYAEAFNNLGTLYQASGRRQEAVKSFEKAIRFRPDCPGTHCNLSNLKTFAPGDPQIRKMETLLTKPVLDDNDKTLLHFSLARAYMDLSDDERAFEYLALGNRLRKKVLGYRLSNDEAMFSRIRSIFSSPLPPPAPTGMSGPRPIFVLGMPRSGTTLVEQILASHSAVRAAGELKLLGNAVIKTNRSLGPMTDHHIHALRESYLAGLTQRDSGSPFITDKMPLNFRWIGFIILALPEAKILHVKRNAQATCWSIYKHRFFEGGNGYAYDQADVAGYYRLYENLMGFWHSKFPGRILDIDYERLTENQSDETRRLLDHAGLAWEDACLEFYSTPRAVRTASSSQIRQKMYQGSSEKWRRYERYLAPMLSLLEEKSCR